MASCSLLVADASHASASNLDRRSGIRRGVGDEDQDGSSLEGFLPGIGLGAELARGSTADKPMGNIPGESPVTDEALPLPPPPLLPRSPMKSLVAQQRVVVPDWIKPDNNARLRGAESVQKAPTPLAEYDLDADSTGDDVHLRKNRRLMRAMHAQREKRRLALSRAAVTASRGLAVKQERKAKIVTPKQRMEDQCLQYADWVRNQGVQGTDFVRLWTDTCTPAVSEGTATPRYVEMCSSLGGAVASFAESKDWKSEDVCKAVLQNFADSEVGATPLVG